MEHTLLFIRNDSGSVDTTAILRLTATRGPLSDIEVFAALKRAVTKWVATTDEGKNVWEWSSQDLNIGDLHAYDAFDDRTLQMLLAEEGLLFKSLEGGQGEEFAYDAVLSDGPWGEENVK